MRALAETWRTDALWRLLIGPSAILTFVIGAAIDWIRRGWDQMTQEIEVWIAYALGAGVVLFIMALIVNITRVPAVIHHQSSLDHEKLRKEVDELNDKRRESERQEYKNFEEEFGILSAARRELIELVEQVYIGDTIIVENFPFGEYVDLISYPPNLIPSGHVLPAKWLEQWVGGNEKPLPPEVNFAHMLLTAYPKRQSGLGLGLDPRSRGDMYNKDREKLEQRREELAMFWNKWGRRLISTKELRYEDVYELLYEQRRFLKILAYLETVKRWRNHETGKGNVWLLELAYSVVGSKEPTQS